MTQKKFAITGNPDRSESDMSNQKPFATPSMHIYKIWSRKIHEIEAVDRGTFQFTNRLGINPSLRMKENG